MEFVTKQETLDQSTRTYTKWEKIWKSNCKNNKKFYQLFMFKYKKKKNLTFIKFNSSFIKIIKLTPLSPVYNNFIYEPQKNTLW